MSNIDVIMKGKGYQSYSRVRGEAQQLGVFHPGFTPAEAILAEQYGGGRLLCFQGSATLHPHGNMCTLQVTLWIPLAYPDTAPLCFVIPSEPWQLVAGHRTVDCTGKCIHPYVSQWRRTNRMSDLLQSVIQDMQADPPIEMRPPPQVPPNAYPQQYQQYPVQHQQFNQQQQAVGFNPTQPMYSNQQPQQQGATYPTAAPVQGYSFGQQPYQGAATVQATTVPPSQLPQPHTYTTGTQNQNQNHMPLSVRSVSSSSSPVPLQQQQPPTHQSFPEGEMNEDVAILFTKILTLADELAGERNCALTTESQRTTEQKQLEKEKQALMDEKQQLQAEIRKQSEDVEATEQWLKANDRGDEPIDVDKVTTFPLPIEQQYRELSASDNALADVIHALQQKFLDGEMRTDEWLKNVRHVATKQFIARATKLKAEKAYVALRKQSFSNNSIAPPQPTPSPRGRDPSVLEEEWELVAP